MSSPHGVDQNARETAGGRETGGLVTTVALEKEKLTLQELAALAQSG
jgi:hypothetical protein